MNSKFFTNALAATVLGVFSAQADTPTSPAPAAGTNSTPTDAMTALFGDPVVAKAKGFEIKQSALDQIVVLFKGQAAANGQTLTPEMEARAQVGALNQAVNIQLLLQTATDPEKAAGQKEADVQFTNVLKRFASPEAFSRQLKAVGMTVEDWRTKSRQEAVVRQALRRALNVTISEAEISGFYKDHPSDFEQSEQVHVRHLLLMTIDPTTQAPLAADQVTTKRKTIEDLLKRARAGEDFAALARQYTEDPGSRESGGEYTFPRGKMVAEFEAAAFALTNNQVSDVVTTKYGFHIIKLLDRVPAKTVDLATASEDIKNYLEQKKISALAPDYVAKLRKSQDLQILDPKLKAATEAEEAAAAAEAAPAPTPAPAAPK
jgi:parvulin-like peptidyl-prolyl isomerase